MIILNINQDPENARCISTCKTARIPKNLQRIPKESERFPAPGRRPIGRDLTLRPQPSSRSLQNSNEISGRENDINNQMLSIRLWEKSLPVAQTNGSEALIGSGFDGTRLPWQLPLANQLTAYRFLGSILWDSSRMRSTFSTSKRPSIAHPQPPQPPQPPQASRASPAAPGDAIASVCVCVCVWEREGNRVEEMMDANVKAIKATGSPPSGWLANHHAGVNGRLACAFSPPPGCLFIYSSIYFNSNQIR